jgi:integrase
MSLVKRGKTWHTHFFVDGQRFRQSLETSDWREAQSKEKDLIVAAKAGKIGPLRQGVARLRFSDAAEHFLADRLSRLAPKSVQTEKERAKRVNRILGDMPVYRITVADVADYIRKRKTDNISNATVNRELDVIRGVLKKAKRWHLFADEIKPLPLHNSVGRALSYEEKVKLLKTAASRPEWQNAAWAATLALNTTMRGCEIKQLRWRDVDLMEKTVVIRRSKTEAGERVIPLNSDAWNAILALYGRAQSLGEVQPGHYLFPACEPSHFDPMRPQKSWRTSWRKLTRLIACPTCGTQQDPGKTCSNEQCGGDIEKVKSPLTGLRFHDLRHHAITELAESQASDSTIMAIAGHVSLKMLQHYSHVRLQAKRTALDALCNFRPVSDSAGKREGYDTNHDTKLDVIQEQIPQVVGKMVELTGIEPVASSLRTRRSPS